MLEIFVEKHKVRGEMKQDEVMILSTAGVSIDLETTSPLQPEGKLLRVYPDDKGVVSLFRPDGSFMTAFDPNDWFDGALKRDYL